MGTLWIAFAIACLVAATLVEIGRLAFHWTWLDDVRNLLLFAGFVLTLIATT